MGLWMLIALVAIYYFMFPKSEDPKVLNQTLVSVCNQYLGGREVDVAAIKEKGKYFELIRVFGTYLGEKQTLERNLAGETKVLMNMISPNNLSIPATVDATLARLEAYPKLVEDSSKSLRDSLAKYNAKFAELIDPKDEMVPSNSIFRKMDFGIEAADNQAKVRIALAQYIKAILEFIKSRNGTFQNTDNKLVFSTPEDQAYFDQLYTTTYEIDRKLEDLISQESADFRQEMNTIRY